MLNDPRHEALRAFLVEKRKAAGLRQVDLAVRLQRNQSYVTDIETGQKRVTVLELVDWASAAGFNPSEALRHLKRLGT